jgi:putative peptide zinc metalloprotease protein
MPHVADLAAATSRPVPVKLRPDLEVLSQRHQGREYVVLKDPLRLKYFRFEEEEFWLLEQLDGTATLEQLRDRFNERYAPRRVATGDIHRLIGMAHRSGLVVAEASGQGQVLLDRRRDQQRRRRWQRLAEILAIRFRGVDPDRLLTRLQPYVGWFFSPAAAAVGLLLLLSALLLVAAHFQQFMARLPASGEFFGATNWIYLAATLAGVKVLHELGHGLACKRFGGECHEIGLLLLCFTPCLYCDVTDSWTLPSKWRRAAIAAAGIYVELWLASIATFVWWYSEPGLVQNLALNVMFVGSVSTLVFNANPLMRYDGYYILSDLAEIPNLRHKASSLLYDQAARFFFGSRRTSDPLLPARHRGWLVVYAIASAAYRWLVAASILWLFYWLTEPYGFKIVGQLLAAAALAALVGVPLFQVGRAAHRLWSQERNPMNSRRAWLRASLIAALLIGFFCLPLPYYVRCAVRLQPHEAASVYVDVAGQIDEILVRPGDYVEQGAPLLKLRNLDLELTIARLETECDTQATRAAVLRQRSIVDPEALAEFASVERSLAAMREELAWREKQREQLTIVAPRSGVVLAAPHRPRDVYPEDQLPAWQGHPLEARNRGATLVASDLVCLVGDPTEWEAIVAIDGRDIDFVGPGQRVDILPAQRPGERIAATIEAVARRDMKVTPVAMSSRVGGDLLTQADSQGRERPRFVSYEAAARLRDPSATLAHGGGGLARIHAPWQTPAARLWRELRRTFHFEM